MRSAGPSAAITSSKFGSGAPRSSVMSAQRLPETTATCAAPARRWRALSVSPSSIWNSWWACLTVATLSPRRVNSSTRRTVSVVLPDFFQPAMPTIGIGRGDREGATVSPRNHVCEHGARLVELGGRVCVEEGIDGPPADLEKWEFDGHRTMTIGPVQHLADASVERGLEVVGERDRPQPDDGMQLAA